MREKILNSIKKPFFKNGMTTMIMERIPVLAQKGVNSPLLGLYAQCNASYIFRNLLRT